MKYVSITTAICAPVLALALSGCGERSAGGKSIQINGSDTMLQVGIAWADRYKEVDPSATITVNGEGSGTGIKALINGTVDIAQSSRAIKAGEIEDVTKAHGKAPVEHIVGYDGIAVFINKDNPVKELSLAQLKGIFGEGGGIENWSQVGGSNADIVAVGRNNASGTYSFFRDTVCGKGVEYAKSVSPQSGSTAVVELCMTTPTAIGYSGMGYINDKVGALAVSKEDGGTAYKPTVANVQSKDYPISRPLYIYTIGEPEGHVKEFLDWIKSEGGQAVLAEEKFVPLN
ncbi:MAG: phosphate transport system substrate-binding protein [Verrucomicrobiales bacterium]|jgi:phosphate transport system substrate-binding protein